MTANAYMQRLFDDWRNGCVDAIVARFAPDAVWHFSAATKPPAIGHAAIEQFLRSYAAGASVSRLRLLRAAESGDTLLFEAVEDFDTVGGKTAVIPYAGVLTFRDGLVTDWRDYFDRALVDTQVAGSGTLPDYAVDLLASPALDVAPPIAGGRFGDLLIDAIQRHGDRIAFVDEDRSCNYRDLGTRIARAIAILDELGLPAGATVAQLSGNSIDHYALIAATYIGGYRSVTLHPLGGQADQAFMLADCGARVLVSDAAHAERAVALAENGLRALCHDRGTVLDCFWDRPADDRPLPQQSAGGAEDIIRVAYTGGTTGRPKGVLLSNRAMVANATMALAAIPWPVESRYLCPAPVSHGAGSIIAPVLVRGGTVILQHGFQTENFCAALSQHRATVTWLVPTMIAALLDTPACAAADLSSLETLIWSGAPMTPARVTAAVTRFGPVLVQCYGQSEAPNTVLMLAGQEQARDPDAAGRPFPGIEVALLGNDGTPVGAGAAGEICVRGPLVMSGYLGMPEATAQVFAGGWLHTGDIGVLNDDGLYRVVDRKKDMLITGGFNVYPKEVEDVLAAQPGIADVAVIGIPDDRWGEAVKAVVVLHPGATIDARSLIDAVRAAKGSVHAPKSIDIVDALPLTPLGKPDKKALRLRYATG